MTVVPSSSKEQRDMPTNLPMALVDKFPAIKHTDELIGHGLLNTKDGICSLCGSEGPVIPIIRSYATPVKPDRGPCEGSRCVPLCDDLRYTGWIARE